MTTTTLNVPDISCGHCKSSIEGAVSALDGVESVVVDIEPRVVSLSYDEATVDLDDIKAAIEEAGYEVAGQA
ncbi:MAG TPA: copper ion binding protein [Acidimicrobiia bacterium]|nr:copper ion binding protein [Acidimicrobiia bacterium]